MEANTIMVILTVGLFAAAVAQAVAAVMEARTAGRLEKLQGTFLDVQKQQADVQQKQYELQKQVEDERKKPRVIAALVGEPHTLGSITLFVEIANLGSEPLWIEEGRAIVRRSDGADQTTAKGKPIRAYVLERERFDVTAWLKGLAEPGDKVGVSVMLACRYLDAYCEVKTLRYPLTLSSEGPYVLETPEG